MTKVNMKSGVKHIGKVYLQIFNVGHGGGERTTETPTGIIQAQNSYYGTVRKDFKHNIS